MKIFCVKTSEIWEKAAERLLSHLNTGRKTLLLLSGGSAVQLYKTVVSCKLLVVSSTHMAVGQVDERFHPKANNPIIQSANNPINENINADLIGKTGLWEWCRENQVPYYTVSQEGTLESAASEYDQVMEKLFREYDFKVAVMGIGEDGHTAGILPGYSGVWDIKNYVAGYNLDNSDNGPPITNSSVALPLVKDQSPPPINSASDGKVGTGNARPEELLSSGFSGFIKQRISITPFAIRQLDYAIVTASGDNKKDVLSRLKEEVQSYSTRRVEKKINRFPATILEEIPIVDILTDQKV